MTKGVIMAYISHIFQDYVVGGNHLIGLFGSEGVGYKSKSSGHVALFVVDHENRIPCLQMWAGR